MTNKILPLILTIVFVFGWFCSSAYSDVISTISIFDSGDANLETADNPGVNRNIFNNKERSSPSDWVKQNQIHVFDDKVVIDINNPQWATFTDTNSMDPVIDAGAHAIEIVPKSPSEIQVGDIVSYKSEFADGAVIHRVVEIDEDKDGWYFKAKGDNNPFQDPGKIRFEQIQRVLIAIIY